MHLNKLCQRNNIKIYINKTKLEEKESPYIINTSKFCKEWTQLNTYQQDLREFMKKGFTLCNLSLMEDEKKVRKKRWENKRVLQGRITKKGKKGFFFYHILIF